MQTASAVMILMASRFYAFVLDILFYSIFAFFVCSQMFNTERFDLIFLTALLIKSIHEYIRDGQTIGKSALCLSYESQSSANFFLRNFFIFSPLIILNFIDDTLQLRDYELDNKYYLLLFLYIGYILISATMSFRERILLHDYFCGTKVIRQSVDVKFVIVSGLISFFLYFSISMTVQLLTHAPKVFENENILFTDFDGAGCALSMTELPIYDVWDDKLDINKEVIDHKYGIHYFQNEMKNGRQLKQSFLGRHVSDVDKPINFCYDEYYIFVNDLFKEKDYFDIAEYLSPHNNSSIYKFVFYKEYGWFNAFYMKTLYADRLKNGDVIVYRDKSNGSNHTYFGFSGHKNLHERILLNGGLF